jgi:hypothetical protein
MKSRDILYGDETGYARSAFLTRGPANTKDCAETLKAVSEWEIWRTVPLSDMRYLSSQLHKRISILSESSSDEQKWDELQGFIVSCTDKAEEIIEGYRRRIACNGDIKTDAELVSSFLAYRDALKETGAFIKELRRGSQPACRNSESILSPLERIIQVDLCIRKIEVKAKNWAYYVRMERKNGKTQSFAEARMDFPCTHIHKG